MTAEELKEKYPPPILWIEYRTSVESVDKLWMTGSTTKELNAPCYANFHIIFKNGDRKDFSKYEDPDKLLADVTEFLKSIKSE